MVERLKPVLWITALVATVAIVVWAGVRFLDGDAMPLASILVSIVAGILLHRR